MRSPKSRPLNDQAREEAAQWLVRFSEGEVDGAGREAFNTWLRASPEHVRAYLRVSALWEDDALFAREGKPDSDELIARALAAGNVVALSDCAAEDNSAREASHRAVVCPPHASELPQSAVSSVPPRRPRRAWAAAFAAAALLGTASFIGFKAYSGVVYTTAVGEQRTITLSDGSTVALNAHSKLSVRYENAQRSVNLVSGQALFRVAKDATRPFVVRSGGTNIRVVGTEFDVYRKPGSTVITVVEGRVAVSGNKPARSDAELRASPVVTTDAGLKGPAPRDTLVSAGEQLIATAKTLTAPHRADVAAATAWTEGKLVFSSVPLDEVIGEFNRHSPRRLIVEDRKLGEVRISGTFSFDDSARFVEFLRLRFGLAVRESSDEIRIAAR